MYQKHHRSDELFTSISLSFSLLLLTLFLIYEKVTSNLTSDMDFYLYIVVSAFFLILFVYTTAFFILNYNYKRLDIGIDFERECIILKNGKKVVQFSEIQLFGYNEKKHDVRLLLDGKLYGFLLGNIVNEKNEAVMEDEIIKLSNYTKTVKHQHLYNFNLLLTIVMVVSLYLYAFLNDDFKILNHSITTLYLFISFVVVYLIVEQGNRYRYKRLLFEEKHKEGHDDRKSDTN
jgi:hypothetical protein